MIARAGSAVQECTMPRAGVTGRAARIGAAWTTTSRHKPEPSARTRPLGSASRPLNVDELHRRTAKPAVRVQAPGWALPRREAAGHELIQSKWLIRVASAIRIHGGFRYLMVGGSRIVMQQWRLHFFEVSIICYFLRFQQLRCLVLLPIGGELADLTPPLNSTRRITLFQEHCFIKHIPELLTD